MHPWSWRTTQVEILLCDHHCAKPINTKCFCLYEEINAQRFIFCSLFCLFMLVAYLLLFVFGCSLLMNFSFILGIGNVFVSRDFFLLQRWSHIMTTRTTTTICVGLLKVAFYVKWRRVAKEKHCCNNLEAQNQIAKNQE